MLKAGFARLDVTPPLGIYLAGYPQVRLADTVRDPLYVNAVVFTDGEKTVAAISLDQIGLPLKRSIPMREAIAARTGLDFNAIILACTHIHTGPAISNVTFPDDEEYNQTLTKRIADAVVIAMQDCKPAKLSYARSEAKHISFVRRYKMKDGSTATNPGRHNPNIDHPIGEPDESVQVIRVVREGGKDIIMVNFQVHPDVVSGTGLSADFPAVARNTVEAALGDVHCVYFNGAQGDTNHVDVNCPEWDKNQGMPQAIHMGHTIAGAVLSVCDKCAPMDCEKVDFTTIDIEVPLNIPKPEEIPWAEKVLKDFAEGNMDEYKKQPMGIPIATSCAKRILALKDSAPTRKLPITAIRFGDIGMTGAPGEPFTDIGRNTKARSPFTMTFYCCCCNGYESYYPIRSAYEEGGYEAKTSRFKAGIAEAITEGNVEALNKIK